MNNDAQKKQIFIGEGVQKPPAQQASGGFVYLNGERFYKINCMDAMQPFFISLVSSSDHWLFIASTGGLTAGRASAEQALFPYYTVDRITENNQNTGNVAVLRVTRQERCYLWEPFSERQPGIYRVERSLYKNLAGTMLIFEEANRDLDLVYRYAWRTGEEFGFIRTAWLVNGTSAPCQVELVDGLQNLLPANVSTQTQNIFSVLLDAYKRSELDPETGLGIFALSSNLTDLAEPSEALLATTVAQVGLTGADYLLSTRQLEAFRSGGDVYPEVDVRGQRGAYLVHTTLHLTPGEARAWHQVADVTQDHAAIARLRKLLRSNPEQLFARVEQDAASNQANLVKLVASADGLQTSQDTLITSHHFANVLFNVMRGGIFATNYSIQAADLREFIATHHPALLGDQAEFFSRLPEHLTLQDLQVRVGQVPSPDLRRLCASYLPLTFSRRHGDPSRPWNRFNINVKNPDGSLRLSYEGNWRDIFQNWEALAWSYPEFIESMLGIFLNATTVDGYNPYRLTRDGVDWEIPEPHNPWANIGYWGDHQIIYLQKLMEISAAIHPGRLQGYLAQPLFSYANVPYRLKPYQALLQDPYSTIEFDWDLQKVIERRVREVGMDGRLVAGPDGQVFHASLAEKLLTLLLAKLANFIPEGGVWMNTQRPEWNDANNALAGKGLSVVTLGYLRRFLVFCRALLDRCELPDVPVSREVARFYSQIADILTRFEPVLLAGFNDTQRRAMMDALGQAGSDYRWNFYHHGLSGEITALPAGQVSRFLALAQAYVDGSLRANRRPDDLYHAYNTLQLSQEGASVSYLYEMLEGQVSILSSGLLSAQEALALLDSLRSGRLYRPDQHSYILYPDRDLPGFLEKNCIAPERLKGLNLVRALGAAQDKRLLHADVDGVYHFNGNLRNIKDVNKVLAELEVDPVYAPWVRVEAEQVRQLFETLFNHQHFTGRSGTFFAYEGLGSIYWHMVAKLLLAVQEAALKARGEPDGEALSQALLEKYHDIRRGLGFNKSPQVYGAFPTDPYSHTPKGQGAKQPGMTGQVKEEILTRQAELGLRIQDGRLTFDPFLLNPQELLHEPATFTWIDVAGETQSIDLLAGALAYTCCQVPVLLQKASETYIEVHTADGEVVSLIGDVLETAYSQHIFQRDGLVHHVCVHRKLIPNQ
jgi:hypothetical protein